MPPRMFVPGPVDVADEVLQAQTRPMLPHRSKEFEAVFRAAARKAQQIFLTDNRVFIATASGSGLQEAAVRNFVAQRLLTCVNGAFAERWFEVAVHNGKQADRLETEWDQPITPDLLAAALQKDHYEAVCIVHNETSTGLQNPVAELAETVRHLSPDTLVLVDAVSSLGGARIDTDAWGLDMVLTSSQKCLALPPGLALAAVSERAMHRAEQVENRGWYFDLVRMDRHRLKDSTPATPAMSLVFALDLQLDRILAEGLDKRFARHTAMASRVQEWADANGIPVYAPQGYRSQTVTTLVNARDWDISALNTFLLQRDMCLANGYGALKNKTFRIAHMGETRLADVDALLGALEEYLQRP